jgi:hypothetical protein
MFDNKEIGNTPMKKTLLATTALAFVAAHASAVDVELYGQVNKGVFGYDDGSNTDFLVTDNALSSTRFGLKGAQVLDNGLTASVLFEGEMASNPSDGLVQRAGGAGTDNTPANTAGDFSQRQARVGLSGNFGGVYVGHQSTAIDSVITQDLAGAQDVMSADFRRIGGGLEFTSAGALSGVSTNDLTSDIGQSRADSIRYDSPIFAGFQARASIAQGGDTEGSVFYDGAMGDFKIKGAAGLRVVNSSDTNTAIGGTGDLQNEYGASVSVAHSSGLAGTLAYTASDRDGGKDGSGWYAKVGYAWDAFEVAADYGTSEKFAGVDGKVNAYGVAGQYNLGQGVSVAALYRNLDSKDLGTDTDSINLYGVNMRVKF